MQYRFPWPAAREILGYRLPVQLGVDGGAEKENSPPKRSGTRPIRPLREFSWMRQQLRFELRADVIEV